MKRVIYNPVDHNDIDSPFFAYPRPQMKRDSYFNLNGEWDFSIKKTQEISHTYENHILVPFPPESSLSGLCVTPEKGEFLHYRRFFSLPENFVKHRVLLNFGAVDQIATVYLNGSCIGTHRGGYLPFSFDITGHLLKTNELVVCVQDDLCKDFPYGKQKNKRGGMWYTKTSGIWQTVWIESVPKDYVRSMCITQSAESVTIQLETDAVQKVLRLKESGEEFRFTEQNITIQPSAPRLWSPNDPYLYEFTLTAGEDTIEGYFALRTLNIQTVNGIPRICLNGKPFFMQALLDQGYYPAGLFLPASPEEYEKDILAAKAMGYNTLRKHIKIEPMLFYHACDRLGIVVFQDIVNNAGYSFLRDTALPTLGFLRRNDKKMNRKKTARTLFKQEMCKTILHLKSVPSVLLYTIFNEGWGQFCADEMFAIAKKTDPSRLYDATSGWFWQSDSDFESLHIYFKPLKLCDRSQRPIIISEFGGYSLRVEGHLATKKNYGYSRFDDKDALYSALKNLYIEQALPLIEKGLCGLVYTQIADVEDETNGLLTYDRKVQKIDSERMHNILSTFERLYSSLQ